MKKYTIVIVAMLLNSFISNAQKAQTVEQKELPKKIVQAFVQKYSDISGVTWYPYPSRYWEKKESVTPTYFPMHWDSNEPKYYEVRFMDGAIERRRVYDRGGRCLVSSRILSEQDIPTAIDEQLIEKGFESWDIVSVEKVSKSGEPNPFYKIWLNSENKKRILFFDEFGKLVKTLKWDNDILMTPERNAVLKNAPNTQKSKKTVQVTEVPEKVRNQAKKNHVTVELLEWVEYTRVYDPFMIASDLSYYDVPTARFYQMVFMDKTSKFKATYSDSGQLLEVIEVLKTKDLPEIVKKAMRSEEYKKWVFGKEHDQLEIDDSEYVYRIYGMLNQQSQTLLIDMYGNNIEW